ncbi:MAG: hypothetical protein O3C21_01445 [Verrucomicrobia bacterium]|nr:hypothetical protein [Verrucomicrobiota bacterium]
MLLESWLIFDEAATRMAAGNPHGTAHLALPPFAKLEAEKNSKNILFDSLKIACGLGGQRLKKFKPRTKRQLVAAEIRNFQHFQPLLKLSAFEKLSNEIRHWLDSLTGPAVE